MSKLLGSVVKQAHHLIAKIVRPGDLVIDATAGNGFDTAFLAGVVSPGGKVFAFDIQAEAIANTKKRLEAENLEKAVELYCLGHEELENILKSPVKAIMFNLGYLPKGDHAIITKPSTTIKAIQDGLRLLLPGGLMTVVLYPGHPGGEVEAETVVQFLESLDSSQYTVLKLDFINRRNNGPFLVAVEKQ